MRAVYEILTALKKFRFHGRRGLWNFHEYSRMLYVSSIMQISLNIAGTYNLLFMALEQKS